MKEFYVFESYPGKKYLPTEEARLATYDDLFEAGYSYENIGVEVVDVDEESCPFDNYGNEVYRSTCGDFEGLKIWDDIKDIETGLMCVRYHDGSNWKIQIFEGDDPDYSGIVEGDAKALEPPSPAYYFPYELTLKDGSKIKVSQSNMSGQLSPYYYEMTEEGE